MHTKPFIAGIEEHEAWGEPETACSVVPLVAGALIGGAMGALPALFGAGKTDAQATAPKMNRSQFDLYAPGFGELARRGDAAQHRAGVYVDDNQVDAEREAEGIARRGQEAVMSRYGELADGYGGAGNRQMQRSVDDAISAQQAMAASARGGSLAMAQARQAAAAASGGLLTRGAQNAAQVAAQEQQAGLAGLAGMSSQLRAMDLQRLGMTAQRAQFVAGLEAQQRQLNDARTAHLEGLGMHGAQAALQGRIAYETANAGNQMSAQNANLGIAQSNAAANARNLQSIVGGAMGGAMGGAQIGGMMGGGGAAAGGAPTAGAPAVAPQGGAGGLALAAGGGAANPQLGGYQPGAGTGYGLQNTPSNGAYGYQRRW